MKKMFFLVAVTVTLSISAFGQIIMDPLGRVGIGLPVGTTLTNRLTIGDQTSQFIGFRTNTAMKWTIGSLTIGTANVFKFRDEMNGADIMKLSSGGSNLYTSLTVSNNLYANNLYATNNSSANILSASSSVKVETYGIIWRNWANTSNFDLNINRPNTDYWGFLFENTHGSTSGYYCDLDYPAIWSRGNYNRLLRVWDMDGRIEKYYLDGNGVPYYMSDKERKENIEPIKSALEKIKILVGVTYDFIKSDEEKMTNDSIINGLIPYAGNIEDYRRNIEKKDCGFIAQELETVIPEVVETSEDGSKFVNYDGVIPFLVEAMKEQQAIIESLQAEIQILKGGTSGSTLNDPKISEAQKNTLHQNTPNPFSQSTVIEYTIAGSAKNAMICIYNMNGNQLKCIPVNPAGHGNIVINGSELSAGMYLYSLIVDGQLIDTKRMVLTN